MSELQDDRVPLDALKLLAHQLKGKLMKEGEVMSEVGDITKIFWKGIRQKLIKGENLSIVCKGQTTKGKSTTAAYIKTIIHKIILDLKQPTSYKGDEEEFELICADQIEFLRFAKREDLHNVVVQIDEYSPMGNVGINSSVENSELDWYNKVCAQKFLHQIFCTPGHEYDKLATIHLEIIDVDKPKCLTKIKVSYNHPSIYEAPILLGTMTVNVSGILSKDWYKLYKQKKHFAMDLLLKHSLKGVRDIECALTRLITFKRMYELATIKEVERTLIINELRKVNREMKSVYSIVGENVVAGDTQAILQLVANYHKKIDELYRPRRTALTDTQMKDIKKAMSIYESAVKGEYAECVRLINLYREYMSIGNYHFKDWIEEKCSKYGIDLDVEKRFLISKEKGVENGCV